MRFARARQGQRTKNMRQQGHILVNVCVYVYDCEYVAVCERMHIQTGG